jgi:hypothetical protein
MPLIAAVALVIGLKLILSAGLRLALLRRGRTDLADLPRPIRIALKAGSLLILPLVAIAVLTASGPTAPSLGLILVVYLAGYLLTLALIFILEQILDRVVPAQAVWLRLAFGHERDTSNDEFKAKVAPPLVGVWLKAVTKLDDANARFARGVEFTHESEKPGFLANWHDLDEAVTALEVMVAAAKPAPVTAVIHLGDARSRRDTLRGQAQLRGISV